MRSIGSRVMIAAAAPLTNLLASSHSWSTLLRAVVLRMSSEKSQLERTTRTEWRTYQCSCESILTSVSVCGLSTGGERRKRISCVSRRSGCSLTSSSASSAAECSSISASGGHLARTRIAITRRLPLRGSRQSSSIGCATPASSSSGGSRPMASTASWRHSGSLWRRHAMIDGRCARTIATRCFDCSSCSTEASFSAAFCSSSACPIAETKLASTLKYSGGWAIGPSLGAYSFSRSSSPEMSESAVCHSVLAKSSSSGSSASGRPVTWLWLFCRNDFDRAFGSDFCRCGLSSQSGLMRRSRSTCSSRSMLEPMSSTSTLRLCSISSIVRAFWLRVIRSDTMSSGPSTRVFTVSHPTSGGSSTSFSCVYCESHSSDAPRATIPMSDSKTTPVLP
mmetsp:Transcript_49141/g.122088  ORF Transcript_49141/g.122088 Transcript_49141/m.122088 type:complete len:393 (-) Transcript_49141:1881-3059(-)